MKSGVYALLGFVFLFGVFFMDSVYIEMTGHAVDSTVDCVEEGYKTSSTGKAINMGVCNMAEDDVARIENHLFEITNIDYDSGFPEDSLVEIAAEEIGRDDRKEEYEVGDDDYAGGEYYNIDFEILEITESDRVKLSYEIEYENCYDSDGGINKDERGDVEWRDGEGVDFCQGGTLFEFSCADVVGSSDSGSLGVSFNQERIECEYGCEAGACLEKLEEVVVEEETCVDLDGGKNYYESNSIEGQGGSFDKCLNDNVVLEQYCDGGEIKTKEYTCPNGCFTGRCLVEGEIGDKFVLQKNKVQKITLDGVAYTFDVPYCTGINPPENMKVSYDSESKTFDHAYHKSEKLKNNIMITIDSCTYEYNIVIAWSVIPEVVKDSCIEIEGGIISNGEKFEDYCNNHEEVTYECLPIGMTALTKPCVEGCVNNKCIYSKKSNNNQIISEPDTHVSQTAPCNGCEVEGKCFTYGTLRDDTYCSSEGFFAEQLDSGYSCSKNYECSSESCVDGECESNGFWSRLSNWFRDLFDSDKAAQNIEDRKATSEDSESKYADEELWCRIGDMFVTEVNGKVDGVEYYGKEVQSPVVGDSVEMCCAKTSDGLYKECNRMMIVNGVTPTSSDYVIKFEKVNGEYLKTFERSYFLNNQCTYSFDSSGMMEARGC